MPGAAAHPILHLLDRFMYSVIWVSFAALPFLLVNLVRYWWSRRRGSTARRRFPAISVGLFVGPILIGVAIGFIIKTEVVYEIVAFVDRAAGAQVSINSKPAADPAAVLAALRSMRWVSARHSHTTARLHIVVRGKNGTLILDLGRDSQRPQEYRVYYPGYRITREQEIDRIVSPAFDAY